MPKNDNKGWSYKTFFMFKVAKNGSKSGLALKIQIRVLYLFNYHPIDVISFVTSSCRDCHGGRIWCNSWSPQTMDSQIIHSILAIETNPNYLLLTGWSSKFSSTTNV